MEKIASFQINHLKLLPGLYVSRVDEIGREHVTTFDLRMTAPNIEPAMDTAAMHAIEHLGATFLRNHAGWKSRIIYFGPMGCRTGFYLLLAGRVTAEEALPLAQEMLRFVEGFEGDIPGASARDCGNYLDMNLPMAKHHARGYLRALSDAPRLAYPQG